LEENQFGGRKTVGPCRSVGVACVEGGVANDLSQVSPAGDEPLTLLPWQLQNSREINRCTYRPNRTSGSDMQCVCVCVCVCVCSLLNYILGTNLYPEV